MSFAIPAFTALLKLTSLKLSFNPQLVVSNVGSDPITLGGLLEAFAKQGGATVNGNQLTQGIITDGYLPTLGNTGNSWIALFKKVHDTYDAKAPFDGNVLYGEAVGYTFVQAMVKAGKNPTRADLVKAINGGLPQGAVGGAVRLLRHRPRRHHRRLHRRDQERCARPAGPGPGHRHHARPARSRRTRGPSRRPRPAGCHRPDAAGGRPPGLPRGQRPARRGRTAAGRRPARPERSIA